MSILTARKLIVIVGPTAVGKTNLAVALAKKLGTEILSADSRQVFKELTIGTAKPSRQEMSEVPHHFIDIKSIDDEYDAGQFGRDALDLIRSLFEKHHYLILCGGSGLYVKAITEGFDEMPDIPEGLRAEINQEYQMNGLGWLQQEVKRVDPEYFLEVDIMNPHRLIRALEINRSSGMPVSAFRKKRKKIHDFSIVKIGLEVPREELYRRIDTRMDQMIEAGLMEEAAQFFQKRHIQALQTVGYQEIYGYMEGHYDREEAIRLLKRNSRRYAKRQITWFKRDDEITWFHPSQLEEIYNFVLSHE